jgi:Ca2+-binding EF-hand superfamily protein
MKKKGGATKTTKVTTTVRQVLTPEDTQVVKLCFECFDPKNTGQIDPRELKETMEQLGFAKTNPGVYEIIASMDSPEYKNGMNFDQFTEVINTQLVDKESKDGIQRIFDLFADQENPDNITLNSLKKNAVELQADITPEELKDLLGRASNNGNDINFDEFYEIMTKRTFA